METCVLIPPELSLILTSTQDYSDKSKNDSNNNNNANNANNAKKKRFSYEMGVRVWSNQSIPQGTRFLPFNGTIRLDKLEVYSTLEDHDVRHQFGCYDEIQEVDNQTVRHCNWIRFLRVSNTPNSADVNLVGIKVYGEPVYEIVKTVRPNTELVVFYDLTANHLKRGARSAMMVHNHQNVHHDRFNNQENQSRMTPEQYKYTMNAIIEDSPLDLSLSLLSSRILITPPSDSEDSKCSEAPPSPSDKSDISIKELPDLKTGRRGRERHMLPCEVCGKAFDRPSLLRRHMRTHTGEKPHVCDVCGKGFSTSSSLNTHRRIHSGEKPHQCPVCGKRFTASSNLYYHRMTHNKEKPHKCSLCSKSFPTPGDLKSHMYVHNGSWPYKCTICNRGFSKQTNLRNHLFLHTGDKPHQCNICQKRFALACNLRAHLKTHDSPPQEDCLKCGRRINTGKNECTSGLCSKCMENTPMKSDAITLKQKETPKARSAQEALVSLAKNEQYLRHSNFPGIPRELQMYYPTSRPMTSTPISTAPHIFASELDMLRTRPFFRVT